MRPLKGSPKENLLWLLSEKSPIPSLCDLEILSTQDSIPWRIRLHNSSTMHYNLHLITAQRKNGISGTC